MCSCLRRLQLHHQHSEVTARVNCQPGRLPKHVTSVAGWLMSKFRYFYVVQNLLKTRFCASLWLVGDKLQTSWRQKGLQLVTDLLDLSLWSMQVRRTNFFGRKRISDKSQTHFLLKSCRRLCLRQDRSNRITSLPRSESQPVLALAVSCLSDNQRSTATSVSDTGDYTAMTQSIFEGNSQTDCVVRESQSAYSTRSQSPLWGAESARKRAVWYGSE